MILQLTVLARIKVISGNLYSEHIRVEMLYKTTDTKINLFYISFSTKG